MSDTDGIGGATAGAMLRDARTDAKLSLADVAAKTRVPQRHLEAIERDDFIALPSTTYAVGFARAHARAVGADEVAVAAAVRSQLAHGGRERQEYQAFEPADPARVPPRALAWTAAIIAVLILGGYAIWRATMRGDGISAPAPVAVASAPVRPSTAGTAPVAASTPTSGPVVLAATDAVWIKVTDVTGKAIVQKQLNAGDTYTVPADTQEPKLTFSRPEVLTITVGGVAVPSLGPPARLVKNALLTPEGLRARATGTTATPTAPPTP
jgi:cytoskeletal protein RodZ